MKRFLYHQWTPSDIKRHFGVNFKEGLSQKDAGLRLEKFGKNSLKTIKEANWLKILISQFANLFIILLLAASLISLFYEGLSQFIILTLIIVLNVSISFYQEMKADKSLKYLKESLPYRAKVLRDKIVSEVDAEDLVAGDIVLLSDGDRVPADLRIINAEGLRVNEATLTGESAPISKKVTVLNIKTPLAKRCNMLFLGTSIYAGQAKGVVVATGRETEFGKIAEMVSREEEKTPLEKRILYIGKILTYVAVSVTIIIFLIGVYRNWNILELITFVIALFVSAVPESLPTVITLALSLGVIGMVKKKAIVRKLSVIEALGSVQIIATDKTGTLTKNRLSVEKIAIFKKNKFIDSTIDSINDRVINSMLLFKAAICSNAKGEEIGNFLGDPLEVAIYESLFRLNKKLLVESKKYPILNQIPFDSDRKYMKVEVQDKRSKIIVVKGAVEKILPFCRLNNHQRTMIIAKSHQLSNQGLKLIGVAEKKIGEKSLGSFKNLNFLGIIAFLDEPIEGIKEAMQKTYKAGIWPIMITGDNPKTSKYIANQIGLDVTDNQILLGEEIDALTKEGLKSRLVIGKNGLKIVARATPKNKTQVVEALESIGYRVAVTGDGVNDSPALKSATVGIAMGIRGSDISKEAADIVLTDDNYQTIISSIAWGRKIYDNIKNSLIFLLSGNFDELFLIILSFIMNLPAPFTAIQILWINLITDSLPAIALAFEPPDKNIIKEKPRSSKSTSFAMPLYYSLSLGAIAFLGSMILYLWALSDSVKKARTLVFMLAVLCEMLFVLSIRAKKRIWQDFLGFFENKYLNVAIIISLLMQVAVLSPKTRNYFQTEALGKNDWLILVSFVSILFIFAELIRVWFDKYQSMKK